VHSENDCIGNSRLTEEDLLQFFQLLRELTQRVKQAGGNCSELLFAAKDILKARPNTLCSECLQIEE